MRLSFFLVGCCIVLGIGMIHQHLQEPPLLKKEWIRDEPQDQVFLVVKRAARPKYSRASYDRKKWFVQTTTNLVAIETIPELSKDDFEIKKLSELRRSDWEWMTCLTYDTNREHPP